MSTLDQDLEWLQNLEPRFWEKKTDSNGRAWMAEKHERLTEIELTQLHEMILRWSLPVQMANMSFGFGVGIVVFEPEKAPIYPGVGEKPQSILHLSQHHLPGSCSTFGHDDRIMFDDGWRVFEPLTHSEVNREILRRCGLPQPEQKGYYTY